MVAHSGLCLLQFSSNASGSSVRMSWKMGRIFAENLRQRRSALVSSMNNNVKGKDLTKEPPRSPRVRVGGYAILARTFDKCCALIAWNIGEYHFDCPLDNMLFGFKGVKGDDFKAEVEKGASD